MEGRVSSVVAVIALAIILFVPNPVRHIQPVPRIIWSPHQPFAREISKVGKPVILRNTLVVRWPAMRWDFDTLSRQLPSLSGVYRHTNRHFGPFYDPDRPMADFAVRRNPYEQNVRMEGAQFWDRAKNPRFGEYLYFTGSLPDSLMPAIRPGLEELLVLGAHRSSINLWVGGARVLAPCHFDGYHNFYVQLHGRKKFRLFPPTNLDDEIQEWDAVLEQGDVLYIPPLWFHEVESLTPSISVNVWTDSEQTPRAEQLQEQPSPLESVSHMARPALFPYAVSALLDRVGGGIGGRGLVQSLIDTRYRGVSELPFTQPLGLDCEQTNSRDPNLQEWLTLSRTSSAVSYAQESTALVLGLPQATRAVWLLNYIEFLAALTIGPKQAYPLLLSTAACIHNIPSTL